MACQKCACSGGITPEAQCKYGEFFLVYTPTHTLYLGWVFAARPEQTLCVRLIHIRLRCLTTGLLWLVLFLVHVQGRCGAGKRRRRAATAHTAAAGGVASTALVVRHAVIVPMRKRPRPKSTTGPSCSCPILSWRIQIRSLACLCLTRTTCAACPGQRSRVLTTSCASYG